MKKVSFWVVLISLIVLPIEAKKLKFPNGAVYEGEVKNKQPHGEGTMTYPDGEQYTGMWVFGQKSGKGKHTLKNGEMYEGEFLNDNLVNGVAIMGLGRYVGTFSGKILQKGSESTDHSYMDGEWRGGKLYNGIYCLRENGKYYNGVMKNGKFYGNCCLDAIDGTRIQNFDGVLNNGLPISGIGLVNPNYNYVKKIDPKNQTKKRIPRNEITSELTDYYSYYAFPEKLPKGLGESDWKNYVYDVTGSMPKNLHINEDAENIRKERIAEIQQEKLAEEQAITQKRLNGIDYIESKEQFEQRITKPTYKNSNSKWGIVEFKNKQLLFKMLDKCLDITLNDMINKEDFADLFEANYQKFLTLSNEDLNKYKSLLDGFVFTMTVPFSEYEPTVNALLDLEALMTSEVVIFSLEKGTVVYSLLTALDKERIPRNVNRGKLLQQQLIAKEYNRGTNTYDFQLTDDVFSFTEIYKVDGKEQRAIRHFKYNKQKDMLYDVDHKLYLEKKTISDYQ